MLTAAEIMTKEVVSVTPQTSLTDLAQLFVKSNFSTMPVIEDDGTLVGIISTTDLVDCDKPLHIPTVVSIFDWVIYLESEKKFAEQLRRISASTVGEICSKDVITCTPQTPVAQIAELMVAHKVHLIPVVDNGIAGVVARLDIVRSMVS